MTNLFEIMDVIYQNEVVVIELLQTRFLNFREIFQVISNVFDPRYAFLFYCPLIFSFNWKIGKKLMWVVIMSEWSNNVLKWLLHGQRPYWWVFETEVYNKTGTPTPIIYQTSLTCETGAGCPSGHSQITAAVWYVIFDSFLEKYKFSMKRNYNCIATICWLAYLFFLVTIGMSRVFIGTHFPHQCIFGMILGWFIARTMRRINQREFNFFHYCAVAIGLLLSALITYGSIKMIGLDPMWTIENAFKWCEKPEYIKLDTSPLFSMMRYCGFTLGMGFGFSNFTSEYHLIQDFKMPMKILSAIISVSLCILSHKLLFSTENLALFYFQGCILSAFRAYFMINVVPKSVAIIWSKREKVH